MRESQKKGFFLSPQLSPRNDPPETAANTWLRTGTNNTQPAFSRPYSPEKDH